MNLDMKGSVQMNKNVNQLSKQEKYYADCCDLYNNSFVYLDGFEDVRITEYQNSLNTLQIYSQYKLIIPHRDTRTIKKSGNYLLSIFSSNGDLIFTRKFLVYFCVIINFRSTMLAEFTIIINFFTT